MPGFLLNTQSKLVCPHGGTGKPFVPLSRVKVMGAPVVGEATTYVISGCELLKATPPPPPCAMALNWQLPATRVKAMGIPVLLASSKAMCIPSGAPPIVTPVQARVKGT